jgi:hypothetical protein
MRSFADSVTLDSRARARPGSAHARSRPPPSRRGVVGRGEVLEVVAPSATERCPSVVNLLSRDGEERSVDDGLAELAVVRVMLAPATSKALPLVRSSHHLSYLRSDLLDCGVRGPQRQLVG